MLVNGNAVLEKALKEGYAVPAYNINNLEWTRYILEACQEDKSPVILAVTEKSIDYFGGVNVVHNTVKSLINSLNITIPVVLHLDHGKSVELCKECVDLGFTSVMIDASAYDFATNIKMTKEVVEYAHAHGVVVESELGAIAGIEDDINVDDKYGHFTHPDDVIEFISTMSCTNSNS